MSCFLLVFSDNEIPENSSLIQEVLEYDKLGTLIKVVDTTKYKEILNDVPYARYIYKLETNVNIEKNILAKTGAPEIYKLEESLFYWLYSGLYELLKKSIELQCAKFTIMKCLKMSFFQLNNFHWRLY